MAVLNSKNRPGTFINLYDRTFIDQTVEDRLQSPLFFQLFSSDKGPENLRRCRGKDFFKLYGNIPSYKKHGQALVQAANIIRAGGELLCKRVVAEDAYLANLVILAKVSSEQVQKVDSVGKPLFIDKITGQETTESNNGTNDRAMINTAKIIYDAVSIKGIKTLQEARTYAEKLVKNELEYGDDIDYENVTKVGDPLTDENPVGQVPDTEDPDIHRYIYPLWIVTDIGRGVSSKRFSITPDYIISKNLDMQMYKFNYIGEVEEEDEYVWFNFNEDSMYLGESRSITESAKRFLQIKAASFDDSTNLFISKLAEITGIAEEELRAIDPIFGKNRKGEQLQQISIDKNGYDLSSPLGMMIQEGDDGSFTNMPIKHPDLLAEQMCDVITGKFDDSITDVDRYQIDAIIDADYPFAVKQALCELADWRKDTLYLRDFGTGLTSYDAIMFARADHKRSAFCADYPQSCDIIDYWSKKQITVTIPYLISARLVDHLINRRNAPLSGIRYAFTFPEIVEGTISYLPKVGPNVDQKELLSDNSLNYISIIGDEVVLETQYTSQDLARTQLGYVNNIFAITQVMHDIRTECPRYRYAFITDKDLIQYRNDVNNVINRRSANFQSITMDYVQDDVMVANKIFEADVFVIFKDYEQQEIFNLYTLQAASNQ